MIKYNSNEFNETVLINKGINNSEVELYLRPKVLRIYFYIPAQFRHSFCFLGISDGFKCGGDRDGNLMIH